MGLCALGCCVTVPSCVILRCVVVVALPDIAKATIVHVFKPGWHWLVMDSVCSGGNRLFGCTQLELAFCTQAYAVSSVIEAMAIHLMHALTMRALQAWQYNLLQAITDPTEQDECLNPLCWTSPTTTAAALRKYAGSENAGTLVRAWKCLCRYLYQHHA